MLFQKIKWKTKKEFLKKGIKRNVNETNRKSFLKNVIEFRYVFVQKKMRKNLLIQKNVVYIENDEKNMIIAL